MKLGDLPSNYPPFLPTLGGTAALAPVQQAEVAGIQDQVVGSVLGSESVTPSELRTLSTKPSQPTPDKEKLSQIEEKFYQIEALARAFSGELGTKVVASDEWRHRFLPGGQHEISFRKQDLENRSVDYALGKVLSEAAKARYSHWLLKPEWSNNEHFMALFNAVETARTQTLLSDRYPGAPTFLDDVYEEDLKQPLEAYRRELALEMQKGSGGKIGPEEAAVRAAKAAPTLPRHLQFTNAILEDSLFGKMPGDLHPEVAKVISENTQTIRESYSLKRSLAHRDLNILESRRQAADSLEVVKTKLWPLYESLLNKDKEDLQDALREQPPTQKQESSQSGESSENKKAPENKESSENKQTPDQPKEGESKNKVGEAKEPTSGPDDKQAEQGQAGQDSQKSGEKNQGSEQKPPGQSSQDTGKNDSPGSNPASSDAIKPDGSTGSTSADAKSAQELAEKISEELAKKRNDKLETEEIDGRREKSKALEKERIASGRRDSGTAEKTPAERESDLDKLLEQRLELQKRFEGIHSDYDLYHSKVARMADDLAGELGNFLQRNSEPDYARPFRRSGKKLDIEQAMQVQAKYERTGVYDPKVWLRRSAPEHRNFEFVFVLDQSGSMGKEGDAKWNNSVLGLVMAGEALQQLEIPFGIIGFSSDVQIHKELTDDYSEHRDEVLGRIRDFGGSATNDNAGLEQALALLKKQGRPDSQKIVVVLSDGQGNSDRVKKLLAEDAKSEGVHVIGLGIGPGTDFVSDVYPEHLVVEELQQMPSELGELIRKQIEGTNDE